nr:uncharacterized protein LOC113811212 [Penaeus vannamei]
MARPELSEHDSYKGQLLKSCQRNTSHGLVAAEYMCLNISNNVKKNMACVGGEGRGPEVRPEARVRPGAGRHQQVLPSSAASTTRRGGRQHRQDLQRGLRAAWRDECRSYWRAAACDAHVHVAYWFYYGYQDTCSPGAGAHDADWEHIIVKVSTATSRHVPSSRYWPLRGNRRSGSRGKAGNRRSAVMVVQRRWS